MRIGVVWGLVADSSALVGKSTRWSRPNGQYQFCGEWQVPDGERTGPESDPLALLRRIITMTVGCAEFGHKSEDANVGQMRMRDRRA